MNMATLTCLHVSLCDAMTGWCEPALYFSEQTTHFISAKKSFNELLLISVCEIHTSDLMKVTLAKWKPYSGMFPINAPFQGLV